MTPSINKLYKLNQGFFVSSWSLSMCRQENLTCDEPEPKVPAVIIERLRLPGGIGGAGNLTHTEL